MFSICVANEKYRSSDTASTIVVISGLAMTAGSKPILSAIIGRTQPIVFAKMTMQTSVMQTTAATATGIRSKNSNFRKFAPASVTPQYTATRISFQITRTS